MEEFRPGGSCGIHVWIEHASGDGRRVSWFAPQNQADGRRLKTPNRGDPASLRPGTKDTFGPEPKDSRDK